jgi:hypothetical protein
MDDMPTSLGAAETTARRATQESATQADADQLMLFFCLSLAVLVFIMHLIDVHIFGAS